MSIFRKIFGSSTERQLKKLSDIQKNVEQKNKPCSEIGKAIIKASYTCSQHLKPMLNFSTDKEKQEAEIWVFYEFIYFYMHLTMRVAFSLLNPDQLDKLQEYLGPLISSTAIDSFFAHWPDDLKEKMTSEFYEKLNTAEIDYSTSKDFLSRENPFTGDSLFSKLARNVAELSGNQMNPAIIMSIMAHSVEAYTEMKLDLLINEAAKVL